MSTKVSRRRFLTIAAAMGASVAWSRGKTLTPGKWRERRDLFPEGVASGDPHADSVILWTRRPPVGNSKAHELTVEVAEDANFKRVVAHAVTNVSEKTDWTCRVLAARLKPRTSIGIDSQTNMVSAAELAGRSLHLRRLILTPLTSRLSVVRWYRPARAMLIAE